MDKLQKLTRHLRRNALSRLKSSSAPLESPNSDNLISQWIQNDASTPFPYSIHERLGYSTNENPATVSVRIEHGRKQQTELLSLSSLTPILSKISSHRVTISSLTRSLPTPPTPLVIEYSSPNIAKPLHMGHLRSTITGKYVARLAEFAGHKCHSITFLGDWGTQFGVLHLGIINKWDRSVDFKEFVHSLTLHELLGIYVESSKAVEAEDARKSALGHFSELERTFGDNNDANAVWNHTRSSTINHLRSCYEKLGIQFDEFEAESMYRMGCEATNRALDVMKSSKILESRDDGSAFVRISDDLIANVLKSDNSSLYLLRDIACALSRSQRYGGHSHVYVVDGGQANHFRNLFHVLNSLGMDRDTTNKLPFTGYTHIPFGKVTGMSTRSGNYVLLDDVINEGTKIMHSRRLKSKNVRNADDVRISEQLAISGLIIHALKMRKTKSYAFDWDSALTSTGNSGVALQYAVARLRSLNERVGNDLQLSVEQSIDILTQHNCSELMALLVCLLNFEDSFWRSYLSLEPCVLVAYAFTLHDRVSKAYNSVKLVGNEDKQLVAASLWVFNTSKSVLECTLKIIGMEIIECGF